jgi:hypothetical protein
MNAIHNARVQLLATVVNNLAVAFVVAGFVAPLVTGQLQGGAQAIVMLAWIGLGIGLHFCGRWVLGGLRQ